MAKTGYQVRIAGRRRQFGHVSLILVSWLIFNQAPLFGQKAPDWFYHPPRGAHHLYSTGLAGRFLSDSLSYVIAKNQAIEQLAKHYSVTITAKYAESQHGSRVRSRGFTTEAIDSTAYWKIYANATLVDSLTIAGNLFLLMAVDTTLKVPENAMGFNNSRKLIRPPDTVPDWVKKPPSGEEHIYGVGISEKYMELSDAWEQSARAARQEIAMYFSMQKSSLTREKVNQFGTYHRKWSEDVSMVQLEKTRILERWYDGDHELFYTLMSAPLPQ